MLQPVTLNNEIVRLLLLIPLALASCAPRQGHQHHDQGSGGEFGDMINGHGLALGCSWYCGAPPVTASESALHDGSGRTVWIAKEGESAMIFRFDLTESDNVSGIGMDWVSILNGDTRSAKKWKASARAKTLNVSFNGKRVGRVSLKDSMEPQRFDLPKMRFVGQRMNEVVFEIVESYPGADSQRVAMADFYFSGFGEIH